MSAAKAGPTTATTTTTTSTAGPKTVGAKAGPKTGSTTAAAIAKPRLTRQHSNEVYTIDSKFFHNLTQGLSPNVPFVKDRIIFFLNRDRNNLIIKPTWGDEHSIREIALNYYIPHISIHKPGKPRGNQNNLYNTKFHFVIGNVSDGRKHVKYYPLDLELLCEKNIIRFNEITKYHRQGPFVSIEQLSDEANDYMRDGTYHVHDAYMYMFTKLPGILRQFYKPCIIANAKAATTTTTTAKAAAEATKKNAWGNNIPEPEKEQPTGFSFANAKWNGNSNSNSVSGGSYKSYVHVPNFGKRLVRYRKNGKAYVILKGKKKNLYK